VGSTELRRADVRLVSATHRHLQAMVADGRFREDLYHRLSTFPIALPPLRVRQGDIPLLATSLLHRVASGRRLSLSRAALDRLAAHPFPGNVRELRNVLERAALLADGDEIPATLIERALAVGQRWAPAAGPLDEAPPSLAAAAGAPRALTAAARRRAAQRDALQQALAGHAGNREALARTLGISLRTLYRRLADTPT